MTSNNNISSSAEEKMWPIILLFPHVQTSYSLSFWSNLHTKYHVICYYQKRKQFEKWGNITLKALIFVLIHFGYCIVCPFSIYGFCLILWYLQPFLIYTRNVKYEILIYRLYENTYKLVLWNLKYEKNN